MDGYQKSYSVIAQMHELISAMEANRARKTELIMQVGLPAYKDFERLQNNQFKQLLGRSLELQESHFADYRRARRDYLYPVVESVPVTIEMDVSREAQKETRWNIFNLFTLSIKRQTV